MSGTLVVAALASLFLELEIQIGGPKLRPFDGLVLVMLLHLALARGANIKVPLGLVLCGLFFLVHAASAVPLGLSNFVREGVQVSVMFAFGLYVYNMLDAETIRRGLAVLAALIVAVMVYNILWHVTHGHMTGWKHLDEPKLAFLFASLLLTFYALKHREEPSRGTLAASIGLILMLPILLLAGERKALLFFLICGLVYFVQARPFLRPVGWLTTLAASIAFLALVPVIVEIPYVEQQIGSLTSPFSSSKLRIYSGSEYVAESLSNAQRALTMKVAGEQFRESPVLGVGTNGFMGILRAEYSHLPGALLKDIHSDILRVLVENGLVGLAIYMIVPLRALVFFLRYTGPGRWPTAMTGMLLFFVGAMILISLESTGSKLMVPYVLLAIMPDMARRWSIAVQVPPQPSAPSRASRAPAWEGGS